MTAARDEDRVDGLELRELAELGSDDRLLRGLLLAFALRLRINAPEEPDG